MSRLFNYSQIKDTANFDGMLPGQQSRVHNTDVKFATIVNPVDLSNGAVEYLESGELVTLHRGNEKTGGVAYNTVYANRGTVAEFSANEPYGVVVADVRGQMTRNAGPNFIYKHPANHTVTVLTQGYIYVPVQDNGDILANGSVYTNKVGGILTASSSDSNKVELPNAKFTGLWGYPLTSKQNGTSSTNLTGKTAEILLTVGLL